MTDVLDKTSVPTNLSETLRAMVGARSDADARVMHLAADRIELLHEQVSLLKENNGRLFAAHNAEIERLRTEVVRLEEDIAFARRASGRAWRGGTLG